MFAKVVFVIGVMHLSSVIKRLDFFSVDSVFLIYVKKQMICK